MTEYPFDVDGIFFSREPFSERQASILRRIHAFDNESFADTLLPLISQSSSISLRVLDWLVTNYAKKHNIVCRSGEAPMFNIYYGYKAALTHYRRKHFDPFRRRSRIFVLLDGIYHETTVGQCNFVHWADRNGVIKFASLHVEEIETDMNQRAMQIKEEARRYRSLGQHRKRSELSQTPPSKCLVFSVPSAVCLTDKKKVESPARTPQSFVPA